MQKYCGILGSTSNKYQIDWRPHCKSDEVATNCRKSKPLVSPPLSSSVNEATSKRLDDVQMLHLSTRLLTPQANQCQPTCHLSLDVTVEAVYAKPSGGGWTEGVFPSGQGQKVRMKNCVAVRNPSTLSVWLLSETKTSTQSQSDCRFTSEPVVRPIDRMRAFKHDADPASHVKSHEEV